MKRLSMILSTIMVLALLLAACAGNNMANNSDLGANNGLGNAGLGNAGLDNGDSELPDTGLGDTTGDTGDTLLETPALLTETETMTGTLETAEPMETETPLETEDPMATEVLKPIETMTAETPAVQTTETPTNTVGFAATITGDRQELTRLSNLIGYELHANGESVGTVNDYIVNTCEAHIIYMVVDGDQGQMLVPFEAATVNSGTLNAEQDAIELSMNADAFANAPTITGTVDLSATEWEGEVRSYWSDQIQISNLSTECGVGTQSAGEDGTIVHKIAYASNLLNAELQDGNQNPLGTIEDAFIQPESGQLMYVIVNRSEGGTVMVPMRAVNIPERAYDQQDFTVLVLLTENTTLQNAPTIDSVESATEETASEALDYWSEYTPLTEGM